MKYSKLFGRTSKNEGTDLKIDSHRLLVQAGYIRESTAGRYYLLPLGVIVHDKIQAIVKKHMDKTGAQQLLTPVLHPLELWQETNRTDSAGYELMQVEDRHGADFALGGTAEEMIIDLVRKFNISYRDLPFNIYQFSMKFRDEMRARGGLLRVREFVMKDAYSFGTEEQFKDIYQEMWDAYSDIVTELGLTFDVVAADNGYIGGDYSHEFVALSDAGESRYFVTTDGSYAAHEDVATFDIEPEKNPDEAPKPREDVKGVGIIGVDELAKHLKIPVEKTTKTILFEADKGRLIAAAISGLYEINEVKLQHAAKAYHLELASEETVMKVTGAKVGYAGVLDLPDEVEVIFDESMRGRTNFEMGANKTDYHSINVNFGRDLDEPDEFFDIALAEDGFTHEGVELEEKKGIEVGNIFQLGHHYTNLMKDSDYTDQDGQRQPYYMGCYGFGIGRTMAAIVEQHHDDSGIVWPAAAAPYQVMLVTLASSEDDEAYKESAKLYEQLQSEGVEVLWDERLDVRPGEKFADADLVGIPVRLVVSQKSLEKGGVEIKQRQETDSEIVAIDKISEKLR